MPTNNADVQRALGQLDQYQRKYGDNLIILSQSDAQRSNRLQKFLFAVLRKSYGDFGPHLNA